MDTGKTAAMEAMVMVEMSMVRLKSWFGDEVEQKIIESAVIFWFKDGDYKGNFKLWDYLKED